LGGKKKKNKKKKAGTAPANDSATGRKHSKKHPQEKKAESQGKLEPSRKKRITRVPCNEENICKTSPKGFEYLGKNTKSTRGRELKRERSEAHMRIKRSRMS